MRDAEAGVGAELHRLVAEIQLTDDRVVDTLGAGAVEAHVVRRPADAELVAARRQLADEVGELAVVGVAACLGAQVSDELGGDVLPLGIEVRGDGIQEREACAVGGLLAAVEHRRVQRAPERVGAEVVQAGVADGRRRGDLVEDAAARPGGSRCLTGRGRFGSDPGSAARTRSKRCARSASSS